MARAPFIVVTDRGTRKAYEVKKNPTHGAMPRLVRETNLQEAHERYRDKVTDQAGSFPAAGSGGKANAIAERQGMEAEEDARALVTRDPSKAEDITKKYDLRSVYDYDHYADMLDSGEADAIYLSVPTPFTANTWFALWNQAFTFFASSLWLH